MNRTMRRAAIGLPFALMLVLTGCASAPSILPLAQTVPGASVETIMVATARQRSDDPLVIFDEGRSASLNFAEIAVSVPPNRRSGKIVYPTRNPDPKTQFLPVRVDVGMSRAQFVSELDAELDMLPRSERVAFVFVHGFNTDFAEGIYRQAQIMHDFDVTGVAVNFSWPSAGKTPLYLYDRDSAQFARQSLIETLEIVADSKAESIIVAGHSMGALLVMEAMRGISVGGDRSLLERLDTVILAAPDIDVDVFDEQIGEIDPVPENFAILISRKDRALQVSQRLRGGHPRVGEGADIEELRREGIYVVDLSGQGQRFDPLNHNTFASSPALIAMAQSGLLARSGLADEHATDAALGAVSDLLAGIIYLPAKAAGVR